MVGASVAKRNRIASLRSYYGKQRVNNIKVL